MKIDQIDTRHGTASQYTFSHGNTLPYTGVPFGMNYFSPQTSDSRGNWWFHPDDKIFQGYRLTHQPSPWMGDFGYLLMTPFSGSLAKATLFNAQSSYRTEEAVFSPTHLKIIQQRYQIISTLTPSSTGGFLSINYQQKDAGLLLTLPGRFKLRMEGDKRILGEIIDFSDCEDKDFTFYFLLDFESEIKSISSLKGDNISVSIKFGEVSNQTIKFSTSFISNDQALINYGSEKNWQEQDYRKNSENLWLEYLNRIEIEHHNKSQVSTFYHNMYRAFLFPQTFYEIDSNGNKIHYDTTEKTIKPGPLYTNNGFWDTFRTVYPLFSLIAIEKYEDMLEGFLNSYRESGFLPKWLSPDERGLMPGTLIDAVIADAAEKGIRMDLMPEFLEAMQKAATIKSENPHYGRRGTEDYLKYGYVPSNYGESVNHTLDYVFSDYCIARVAEILGQTSTAEIYRQQAKNYKNIFDKKTGLMRSKNKSGSFDINFDSYSWGGPYTEGSSWQTSFSVLHDMGGLIEVHGGMENFEHKLIELCNQEPKFVTGGYDFEIHEMSEMAALEFGQVAISNQPSFHYPYMFAHIGKPWMAQPLLKNLMTEVFDDTKKGYPGDEDNGSMASWFIFSSLGFYPMTPGSGQYIIGIPFWDKATLKLSSGKQLVILASPNKTQQMFVQDIKKSGISVTNTFFTHKELIEGQNIQFTLGTVPNPKVNRDEELPFSFSKKHSIK